MLVPQRALHLTLGLTEILLDLAHSFLGPTVHTFARVARSLTEITAKLALGFVHLALRLDLKTALADRHTSPERGWPPREFESVRNALNSMRITARAGQKGVASSAGMLPSIAGRSGVRAGE